MNLLATGKRHVYLAFFLFVTMIGFFRLNLSINSSNTNHAPTPNDPKQSDHTIKFAIPQTPKAPTPAAELLRLATATALPGRIIIQETAEPLTATAEIMSVALTPTLSASAQPISDTLAAVASLPSLPDFIHQVSDGQANLVRGLYVTGVMALRVVQQPPGDPGYISAEDGTATLFQSASRYGVTGLLAHNFLSGREFFSLTIGQSLNVIYGDGHVLHYKVSQIDDFQRLSVNDLRSNFLELNSRLEKTTDQVFSDYYQGAQHLTLQTCIERNGEWNWGVRFIKAEPAD
jgi:hypothetical protein